MVGHGLCQFRDEAQIYAIHDTLCSFLCVIQRHSDRVPAETINNSFPRVKVGVLNPVQQAGSFCGTQTLFGASENKTNIKDLHFSDSGFFQYLK